MNRTVYIASLMIKIPSNRANIKPPLRITIIRNFCIKNIIRLRVTKISFFFKRLKPITSRKNSLFIVYCFFTAPIKYFEFLWIDSGNINIIFLNIWKKNIEYLFKFFYIFIVPITIYFRSKTKVPKLSLEKE